MTRLPFLFGVFLSVSVSGLVLLLSLLAKVSLGTMLFRVLVVFFFFGFIGVVLGTLFETVLMPISTKREEKRLKEELKLDDENIEKELGDLLNKPDEDGEDKDKNKSGKKMEELKPVVVPRMTVENGKVVSRGDSAVVS